MSVVSAVRGGRDELTKGSNDLTQRNDESSRTVCPRFDCSATRRYTRIPRLLVCHFHFPRALRPCDQDSPISVWKPVYLLRAFVYHEWWATEGNSTPDSFVYSKGKRTFLEWRSLKNTWPFMRLIEVKEKARVFKGEARIQSSESDEREGEVLAWKHVVSFSRLATVYCTLLCYNCQLKLTYSLVFIFYSCSSFLMKINHSHLTWLDPGQSIPQDPKFGVEFKQ